jgi:hypothetical protein
MNAQQAARCFPGRPGAKWRCTARPEKRGEKSAGWDACSGSQRNRRPRSLALPTRLTQDRNSAPSGQWPGGFKSFGTRVLVQPPSRRSPQANPASPRARFPSSCFPHAASRTLLNSFLSATADCRRRIVAQAYVSTACAAAAQEARVSQPHENQGRQESPCPAPEKGTAQSHARLRSRGAGSPVLTGCAGRRNSTPSIASAGGAPRNPLPYSCGPTHWITAGLASASEKRWAALWCAIACAGAFVKFFAFTSRRFPRDGTLSFTRTVRRRAGSSHGSKRNCAP